MIRPDLRELTLELPRDGRPKYLRIADALREAIRAGRVGSGERIPSVRELAAQLRTNRLTVLAAAEELIGEGWIVSEYRRGYRVASALPSAFLEAPKNKAPSPARRHRFALRPRVRLAPFRPEAPVAYNFQSGLPDLRLFPLDEFRALLREAIRRTPRSELLGYGDPRGFPPLREALADYLRRVRGIQGREVQVTHGSQEAVYLAIRLLVAPGDAVAVEALGYPPAREALRLCGARLHPLPIGREGIDVDAFARLAARERIRLLYVTPLHQFPTTRTLSLGSRSRLYEIAARFGIAILEDDYDHEYHFRCQPPVPLAAHDRHGIVIYVSTFSKVLFPGARLGFVALPEKLQEPFVQYRRLLSHENATLLQSAVHRWIVSGGLERHIRKTRRRYEERCHTLGEALAAAKDEGLVDFTMPDGGMAIWVDCRRDSDAIAAAALRAGIFVSPESAYRQDSRPGTCLRLGFSNQTPQELQNGIRRLLPILAREPA